MSTVVSVSGRCSAKSETERAASEIAVFSFQLSVGGTTSDTPVVLAMVMVAFCVAELPLALSVVVTARLSEPK